MILFIIAYILLLPLSLLNYIVVAFRGKSSGYFRSTAVNMDKFGNREFRSLFNATLRTDAGYRFGGCKGNNFLSSRGKIREMALYLK